MATAMKFEDTANLIKEMMTVYETDDAAIIHEIAKKHADCQKIVEKRQQEAKRIVKEMQTAVMTQEQELGKHVPPEIHAARLENLERQKETIATNILNLEKEHQAIKESTEETKREEEELRKKRKQQEEIKVPEGPMISLYQIISNIKWDYESPHVAGYIDIVAPETKTVIDCKTFNFDPAKSTQFAITNAIWDMMDA